MTLGRDSQDEPEQEQKQTRIAAGIFSLLRRSFAFLRTTFFGRSRTSASRRAFMQGRLWRLNPNRKPQPLVMRYPRNRDEVRCAVEDTGEARDTKAVRNISGISIEPVAPTNLSGRSLSSMLPVHRPPGAIDELLFLKGCTRCSDCVEACPYDAIVQAPDRLAGIAGTPVIVADDSACVMCEDFPCISSCEPGVLSADIPPIMGTAQITEHLCLAHHHTTCTACSERCPVDGAITVAEGKPLVNEDTCTGCGVCRYVCPAPENAILLMPAYSRPELPNQ